jgi:hypothetical protein
MVSSAWAREGTRTAVRMNDSAFLFISLLGW